MGTREEPQLDFAKAIREATELKEIGKITEEQYRWAAVLLARAKVKPETLTETEAMIIKEVARKIFAVFAINKELRRLEAKFDELLAECDKERLAAEQQSQTAQEPPAQPPLPPATQNPDTPPQDPKPETPANKTP